MFYGRIWEEDGILVTVVFIADLHIGSTLGLCPPVVDLDDRGSYRPSREQAWLWRAWGRFWERVEEYRRGELWVVVLGDMIEGDHHGTPQIFTRNLLDQEKAAVKVLAPRFCGIDRWFAIRGSRAHDGLVGQVVESIGADLGAEEINGLHSTYHLRFEAGGVVFDAKHVPRRKSNLIHTRGEACSREAFHVRYASFNSKHKPPDVVVRAHVHYFAQGWCEDTYSCICPPWQLATAYVWGFGGGDQIEPPGGLLFWCEDGHYQYPGETPAIRFQPPGRGVWKL